MIPERKQKSLFKNRIKRPKLKIKLLKSSNPLKMCVITWAAYTLVSQRVGEIGMRRGGGGNWKF